MLSRAFLLLIAAGCGDDSTPPPDGGSDGGDAGGPPPIVADRPECENLSPVGCLVPYPSSRYVVADSTTATGFRVEYPTAALPRNQFDEEVSSTAPWNGFDGFSPQTSMLTAFEGKLDTSILANELEIADSLLPDSPTVLVDAESGERVAHWAEVNEWQNADADRDSLFMRPAVRLQEDHRYIVAIRGLRLRDGSPVEPSGYFRALRDGTPTDVAELEARRTTFEEIFGILETAGVARDDLIIAWDFRTASAEDGWGTLLRLRDDALTRVGARGLGCTVTRVEEDVNDETWRRIRGTFTVPLYMEHQYEGAVGHRDGDGEIAFNEMTEAPFTFVIPYSVRDAIMAGGDPVRIMMYGHGLLGTSEQVNSQGTREILQQLVMAGVGTDYWGLSEPDEANFVNHVMTQFGNFNQLAERLLQGSINSVVLARSFRGVCSELPELQVAGRTVYDPDAFYYFGISQGGLMGTTLAGLTSDIERFGLQVGAVNYTLLMRRSTDFNDFERVYELWYTDMVERDWLIVSTQNAWDLTDPGTFAPHLLRDPLAGSPVKRILYQTSRYDTEVANAASDIAARSMGLPWFRSSVYEPWAMGPGTAGPEDSGYVIYHLDDVEPIPIGSRPYLPDNNAHDDLRYQAPVRQQLDMFLRPDGRVVDTCPMGTCEIHNTELD